MNHDGADAPVANVQRSAAAAVVYCSRRAVFGLNIVFPFEVVTGH